MLRARTTSAPGRRAVDALGFRTDRAALEREFAAVAEAIAYLRAGSEMGFGALADPEPWLERMAMPGAVLAPAELLDAASLGGYRGVAARTLSRDPCEISAAH